MARCTKLVDWSVIRARCESGDVGLREIARLLAINHNTVRQRARREHWQIPKDRLARKLRTRQAQALARATTTEETLAPIRDHFAQLGVLTKNQLAHLILSAVEELRKLNGLDLLANIQGLGVVTRAAGQIHGWDSKQADGVPSVNVRLLSMRPEELLIRPARDVQTSVESGERPDEPVREVEAEKAEESREPKADVKEGEIQKSPESREEQQEIKWVSVREQRERWR